MKNKTIKHISIYIIPKIRATKVISVVFDKIKGIVAESIRVRNTAEI